MKQFPALFAVAVIVVLAGCRTLPLPAQFDLLPSLGDAASGTVDAPIGAGAADDFTLQVPPEGERCQALDVDRSGVTIETGSLSYELRVTYEGPSLRGSVLLQPFVGANEATIWEAASALGEPLHVDLDAAESIVADTVRLTRAQVDALNDRRVCVGLLLQGTDIVAEDDGEAVVAYEVRRLRLRIGFSLF